MHGVPSTTPAVDAAVLPTASVDACTPPAAVELAAAASSAVGGKAGDDRGYPGQWSVGSQMACTIPQPTL